MSLQNEENRFTRSLNIRGFGNVDLQSEFLTVSGSPLNEGTVLVHRGLTAVSDASTSLTTGGDLVTASGLMEVSRTASTETLGLTFSDNRVTSIGSFEFVVGSGGSEMVASLSGQRAANGSEVTWTLDGDEIGRIGIPWPVGTEAYALNETRVFARGTHRLEWEVSTEVGFNNNGLSPPAFDEASISHDLEVTFTTPAMPPPIPLPVRFVWTGQVPTSGDVTLTNPNVMPGETWELVFTLEGDHPDTSAGSSHTTFIDPSITPTIQFSGGYSVPVSTLPGFRMEIIFGTFQILTADSLDGSFLTSMGFPFATFLDDLPPDGTYTVTSLLPTESFRLTNGDGEISYPIGESGATLTVRRVVSVPSASAHTLACITFAASLIGCAVLRKRIIRNPSVRR